MRVALLLCLALPPGTASAASAPDAGPSALLRQEPADDAGEPADRSGPVPDADAPEGQDGDAGENADAGDADANASATGDGAASASEGEDPVDDEPEPDPGPPAWPELGLEVVTLEESRFSGTLAPAADGRIGVELPVFEGVLELVPEDLRELTVSGAPEPGPFPEDAFRVELAGGDLLHARLLDVDDGAWTLDAAGLGVVRVPRASLTGAVRVTGGGMVFNGPQGLSGWTVFPSNSFVSVGGRPRSSGASARLTGEFGLEHPREARLVLGWEGAPRFRVVVGHPHGQDGREASVTLEVWGDRLVAWRPVEDRLDVVELLSGLRRDGELELRLRVQPESVTFLDSGGAELGTIARPSEVGPYLSLLVDAEKPVELRELQVFDGEGRSTRALAASEVLGFTAEGDLRLADGSVPLAELFELRGPNGEPDGEPDEESDKESDKESDGGPEDAGGGAVDEVPEASGAPLADPFELVFVDGRRLHGELLRVGPTGLEVRTTWQDEPVVAGFAGLQHLFLERDPVPQRRIAPREVLTGSSGALPGELVGIDPDGTPRWRPDGSESALRIVPSEVEELALHARTAFFAIRRKYPHALVLRSGDAFRCRVVSIRGDEITFETPLSEERTLPASEVKTLELEPREMQRTLTRFGAGEGDAQEDGNQVRIHFGQAAPIRRDTSEGFDPRSLERALALPRKYKQRAFEHLVLALNGDFLRTTVRSWDENGLVHPGLGGTDRVIPNVRLAAIVWLEESEPPEVPEGCVRVRLGDENALTLRLTGLVEERLQASSPVLGDVEFPLRYVTSIEFDPETFGLDSPYTDWVLRPMAEPFPDDADADEER